MYLPDVSFRQIGKKQMMNLPNNTTETPGLLRKVAAFVLTMAMFALVLMFSVLLFAVVFTGGAIAMGYMWWRTRELRKQMREHPTGGVVIEGEVIEGEVIEGEVIEGEVIEGEVIEGEVVREVDSRDRK
jgi:hypothetical protein